VDNTQLRKSFEIKESAVDLDARTFEGYASTFEQDQMGDIIHPGAFKRSIDQGFPAGRIKVLWQHNEPLGMPTEMHEDSKGLFVRGRISKTRLGDEALELMRDGVVDRMSIGFFIPKGKSDTDEDGIRHIREVKLMEFSPVTFPANEGAEITAVKNALAYNLGRYTEAQAQQICAKLREIEALLKGSDPGAPTLTDQHPPNLDRLKSLFDDFGLFAQQLRGSSDGRSN
jgi:HK97 family phage prohead protease